MRGAARPATRPGMPALQRKGAAAKSTGKDAKAGDAKKDKEDKAKKKASKSSDGNSRLMYIGGGVGLTRLRTL